MSYQTFIIKVYYLHFTVLSHFISQAVQLSTQLSSYFHYQHLSLIHSNLIVLANTVTILVVVE